MTKTLLLLLAALGAASAMENFFWLEDYADEMGEAGRGCCLPTQWEGRVGAIHVTKRYLRPKIRASDSKVGLDYTGKKVAARSMFYCPRAKKIFETRTVVDFNARKAYFIYKDKCKTFSVKKPMSRPCIPDFFKQFAPYTYGVGASSTLGLVPYGYRNGSLAVFSVVTSGSCAPVKGAYRVKRRFHSRMGSYQYFNITIGNRDRDLYTVPDFCSKANVTAPERDNLWRKFKKYVSFSAAEEPEFNADSELNSDVNGDPLTQLMDIIDSSAGMMVKAAEEHTHSRGSQDRWYQRRWRSSSEDRED